MCRITTVGNTHPILEIVSLSVERLVHVSAFFHVKLGRVVSDIL